jgi:hypothetical protein
MDLSRMPNTVILGAGGAFPNVSTYDIVSGEINTQIEVSHGHSVYSIDIGFENGMIGLGTRGGLIKIIPDPAKQEAEGLALRTLIQGAPILSVSWIGNALLAVSDNAGRCLLWETDQEAILGSLEVTEGSICSMTKLDNETLAGLSSSGELHLWHLSDQQLLRIIKGPSPPPMKALIHMVYWPGRQALVWPAQEGRLALFDPKTEQIVQIDAHRGDFYAISAQGNNLITTGMKDGRLKIWVADAEEAVQDHDVPTGIISMAIMRTKNTNALLVGKKGAAILYSIEKEKLQFIREIPGKDYRTVKSHPWETIQIYYDRQRSMEVKNILAEIQTSTGRVGMEVINGLHSQLIDLGYEHVSLGIRADQANQRGDIAEVIKLRSDLVSILPGNDPGACLAMEKYATILEKAWHLVEADAVCKRIITIDPGYRFELDTSRIEAFGKIINEKRWFVDSDIPIEQIIRTATIIEKTFSGRYLIKASPPESSRVKLDPEAVIIKYKQLQKEDGKKGLPEATMERLAKISRSGIHESEYITFGNGKINDIRGLQMVLQIMPGDLGTVVTPMILFDWHTDSPEKTFQEGNEKAEKALNNIRSNASSNSYLSAVYRVAKNALRRILTEKLQEEGPHA